MKFMRNEEGFTGLEAAIVLIAFVVVAAVFSYVMLGAGFFTSQKSQEVVHSSVAQASSSVEVVGNVIGLGDGSNHVDYVDFTIATTAGGSAFDLNNLVMTYWDQKHSSVITNSTKITPTGITLDTTKTLTAGQWGVIKYMNDQDGGSYDSIVEPGEQVVIEVAIPNDLGVNEAFAIELKPAVGATLQVKRTTPPQIDDVNVLY
ncbi:flagellin [Methanofollis formosanus]|uniref:Flagellin n=1 Tax=Methanofollis formosanus TaxID=299308 RepID=A0A8G1A391_9EURY|nr:archaellin/type IV pilin N-terminal domain-containing protein [Methanofollis formosanus]QYZ80255.1 flagellin [Methanofollis formosanus]